MLTHAAAQPDKAFYDAWIQVDADKLDAITRMPQVVAVAYASPRGYFDDEMSDQIIAGNYNASNQPQTGYAPWLVTFGYDGTGVVMGVTDSGVDLTHPDLSSRVVGGYTFPGCSSPPAATTISNGGHGTHVAGIIAGQGVGDGAGAVPEADANGFLYGLGVAKGAQIYAMATVDCGAPWPPSTGWQELSKRGLRRQRDRHERELDDGRRRQPRLPGERTHVRHDDPRRRLRRRRQPARTSSRSRPATPARTRAR